MYIMASVPIAIGVWDSKKQEYGSIQDHILFSSIAIVFENNRRTSLSLPVENHVSGRDERNLNRLQ